MKVSLAKENILKRVRNALSQPVQLPFPHAEGPQSVFNNSSESPEIRFAEKFTALGGRFVFCASHDELAENLRQLAENKRWSRIQCKELQLMHILESYGLPFLNPETGPEEPEAAITTCECLVARTGSVMISSALPSGRTGSIFPPVHIVIAYLDQLVADIRDALVLAREKYDGKLPSMISLQSGPSRTADIEKTLVVGVHGPGEVYVFLVDQEQQ